MTVSYNFKTTDCSGTWCLDRTDQVHSSEVGLSGLLDGPLSSSKGLHQHGRKADNNLAKSRTTRISDRRYKLFQRWTCREMVCFGFSAVQKQGIQWPDIIACGPFSLDYKWPPQDQRLSVACAPH